MSRTCPYCGTELPDDSLFCIRCGEQVREGGSLSGTGTAPGQPGAPAEIKEASPLRETAPGQEVTAPGASGPQSGQCAGAESICPAQAEGTTAERMQETGAPEHAEPDGTPGAASLRKENARRGVFALVRIFGSWGALFVMALLSLMKIGRLSVSGIKIDLSIFDLMNVLPQQSSSCWRQ